jgi:hypothetical protein
MNQRRSVLTERPSGFFNGTLGGNVLGASGDGTGSTPRAGGAVGSMAASASAIRNTGQSAERNFAGAPRFWFVTNRAKLGHVKVWRDTFDGEVFPEGATEDKNTWLQPGETMNLPLEAALHFFGNLFDPALPDCDQIISRTGGFELETRAAEPARGAQTRIIGGPIGLPDFAIQPQDGRGRNIGEPVELYSLYFEKTKRRIMKRVGHDPAVLEAEKELLFDRISDYTNEDRPLYEEVSEPVKPRAARS